MFAMNDFDGPSNMTRHGSNTLRRTRLLKLG